MAACMEVVPVENKRKRSDWRTCPRDKEGDGLSFVDYLTKEWPRGVAWKPCSAVGVLWKLHDTPRNKKGGLSGKPRLNATFVKWLDGERVPGIAPADQLPVFTAAEIGAAIERAKLRDRQAIEVLEWRQERGPCVGLTPDAMCQRYHLASDKSLTDWFYKAVRLVLDEMDRGRGGVQ